MSSVSVIIATNQFSDWGFWNPPTIAGQFKKVEIREAGWVIADGRELDFRGVLPGHRVTRTLRGLDQTPPHGGRVDLTLTPDGVYTLQIIDLFATLTNPVANVTQIVQPADMPNYIRWPQGETQAPQTITEPMPRSGLPLPPTYAEKQAKAVAAIENVWRPQKRTWMLEAHARSDLDPQVPVKVGAWLKHADAALYKEFTDPSIDPLVVEKMAIEASKGALDVTDVDQFMRSVYYAQQLPTNAILWVTKGNPNVEEVARVNLANIVDYGAGSFKASYDPIDTSWIKENQDGKFVLSSQVAVVGTAISTTLTDPDGGVKDETYQWQSKSPGAGWTDITGATSSSYTPVAGDAGDQVRCKVTYTDNYGSGNEITSVATTAAITNQPGSITLDDTTPVVGTAITASLTDSDIPISGEFWHWQRRDAGSSDEWVSIVGGTAATYTPVTADVGKELRAVVVYTDNLGSGNTAISAATSAVSA